MEADLSIPYRFKYFQGLTDMGKAWEILPENMPHISPRVLSVPPKD